MKELRKTVHGQLEPKEAEAGWDANGCLQPLKLNPGGQLAVSRGRLSTWKGVGHRGHRISALQIERQGVPRALLFPISLDGLCRTVKGNH